jgi:hypothetical protein
MIHSNWYDNKEKWMKLLLISLNESYWSIFRRKTLVFDNGSTSLFHRTDLFQMFFTSYQIISFMISRCNMSLTFVIIRGYRLIFCLQPLHIHSVEFKAGLDEDHFNVIILFWRSVRILKTWHMNRTYEFRRHQMIEIDALINIRQWLQLAYRRLTSIETWHCKSRTKN